MKGLKITYWISTVLTALLFAMSAVMYLTHNPKLVEGMHHLGYPPYMLNILGTAKALAVIALLVPGFPRIREWAYAGLFINMIGAMWSHAANGEADKVPGVLVPLLITLISYITWHRMQAKKAVVATA